MIYQQELYAQINTHYARILKEDKFKQSREEFVEMIKTWLAKDPSNELFRYIFRPVSCSLFEVTDYELYDDKYKHLEYLPLINHRLNAIGSYSSD